LGEHPLRRREVLVGFDDDPRHFVKTDIPLLIGYVQAILLAKTSSKRMNDDPHNKTALLTWEKGVAIMGRLATRLRLAPQARLDAKQVGRFHGTGKNPDRSDAPWNRGKADDDDE
jgi:hypothetical protein